jgi:hypothetical protein
MPHWQDRRQCMAINTRNNFIFNDFQPIRHQLKAVSVLSSETTWLRPAALAR